MTMQTGRGRTSRTGRWLCVLGLCLAGCEPAVVSPRPSFRDPGRAAMLMRLAAQEAVNIRVAKDRLSRQLNIANLQNQQGHSGDARATLALARQTLSTAADDALDAHARISGWVSISELSRAAGDRPSAESACDEGLKFLRVLKPAGERCQYVCGLAEEFRILKGKDEAAKVLREAGPWAETIAEESARRQAIKAIAGDLFLCDDYDGGKEVVQKEKDPLWRTDTLVQLAMSATPRKAAAWGKSLRFNENYYDATMAAPRD